MSQEIDRSALGTALIVASAAAFSTAGLFTRLIELDVWTMLFWRGIVGGAFIAACVAWHSRARTLAAFRTIGRAGALMAACSTLATICFINALRRTTVADVTLIYATAPFVTAALGWLWTGERESRKTLVLSLVALAGVGVMVGAALSAGHIVGDLLGLTMTVLIAAMMVIIRHNRQTPMLPAASLSAFACAVLVAPFASPAAATATDLIYLVLFGTTQFGLGLLLLTLGSRLISPTRSALIGNLESPLAPIWVWLGFGEIPETATLIGGAVVMVAVLTDVLLDRPKGVAAAPPGIGPNGDRTPMSATRCSRAAVRPRVSSDR